MPRAALLLAHSEGDAKGLRRRAIPGLNRWGDLLENMNTIRREIISLLSGGEHGAKDISRMLRIAEKDVYTHLEHISRSLKPQKMRLRITPAVCLACGFKFEARNRFSSPGRCPRCKGEHIQDPKYII